MTPREAPPLVTTLPDHHEIAAKLPAEERPWFFMRLGKLLARKPAIPNAHYLAYARAVTK
jgi:hypothetical protein